MAIIQGSVGPYVEQDYSDPNYAVESTRSRFSLDVNAETIRFVLAAVDINAIFNSDIPATVEIQPSLFFFAFSPTSSATGSNDVNGSPAANFEFTADITANNGITAQPTINTQFDTQLSLIELQIVSGEWSPYADSEYVELDYWAGQGAGFTFESDATVTEDPGVIKGVVLIDAQFGTDITGGKIEESPVSIPVQFGQAITAENTALADTTIDTQFSQSTSGINQNSGEMGIVLNSDISTTANNTIAVSQDYNTAINSSINAAATNSSIVDYDIATAVDTIAAVDVNAVKDFAAQFTSDVEQSVTVGGAINYKAKAQSSATAAVSVNGEQSLVTLTNSNIVSTVGVNATTTFQTESNSNFAGDITQQSPLNIVGNFAVDAVDSTVDIGAEFDVGGVLQSIVIARGNLDGDIDADMLTSISIVAQNNSQSSIQPIQATFTQDTQYDVFVFADLTLESPFNTDINATNDSQSTADFFSLFSFDAQYEVLELVNASATIEAAFGTLITANNTITLAGEFDEYTWDDVDENWPSWPNNIWGYDGSRNLVAQFTQDTLGGIAEFGNILFASQFSSTIGGEIAHVAAAQLDSQFDFDGTSGYILPAQSQQSAEFNTTIDAGVTHSAISQFDSQFDITAQTINTVDGQVLPNAEFTTTVDSSTEHLAQVEFQAFFTQVNFGSDFDLSAAQLDSEFTTDITARNITGDADTIEFNAETQLNSDFTIVIPGELNTLATFDLESDSLVGFGAILETVSEFELTGDARNFVNSEVQFETIASQITIGREQQPDPYRKVIVNSESRILKVINEERTLSVSSESRILEIPIPPYIEELNRRVA